MNNRGFIKTIMIMILLFLVIGLYYYTEPTKEVLGMLTAKSNVTEEDIADVVESIDQVNQEAADTTNEEAEEPVESNSDETLIDASQSAHLVVTRSGDSGQDILAKINPDSTDE